MQKHDEGSGVLQPATGPAQLSDSQKSQGMLPMSRLTHGMGKWPALYSPCDSEPLSRIAFTNTHPRKVLGCYAVDLCVSARETCELSSSSDRMVRPTFRLSAI